MAATEFDHVAVLGAGIIGSSWTALFLAAGLRVEVYDPIDGAESAVRDTIERAWPMLTTLGMTEHGNADAIRFHTVASDAVKEVQFVQESVPERLALKHQLYGEIEPHLAPEAIVASSASG